MGKLLSGICCVIVGLEVLIGVPLAVCLSFFAVTQGGPVVQEYHANPFPATIQPPTFAGPATFAPPPPVAPFPPKPVMDSPPVAVVLPPEISEKTLPTPTPAEKDGLSAEIPVVAAIVESRERVGSPLTGTILAPAAGESTEAELVQSLREIVAEDRSSSLPPLSDPIQPPTLPQPPADEAPTALKQSVDRLYLLAGRFEDEGQFGRADRLRTLARGMREELESIRKESEKPAEPPIALAPATTTN